MPAFMDSEIDDPELLSNAAGEIYRMRRARDRYLPKELTGEPAWDILLALYAEEPAKLPVSSLCFGSGAPQTTALRWIAVLEKAGLPCGPVNNVAQAIAHPQVAARNMLIDCDDPVAGSLQLVGNPMKLSAFADPPSRAPAPDLDADRAAILRELGL